jgi:hypothetical protein
MEILGFCILAIGILFSAMVVDAVVTRSRKRAWTQPRTMAKPNTTATPVAEAYPVAQAAIRAAKTKRAIPAAPLVKSREREVEAA